MRPKISHFWSHIRGLQREEKRGEGEEEEEKKKKKKKEEEEQSKGKELSKDFYDF